MSIPTHTHTNWTVDRVCLYYERITKIKWLWFTRAQRLNPEKKGEKLSKVKVFIWISPTFPIMLYLKPWIKVTQHTPQVTNVAPILLQAAQISHHTSL